MIILVILGMIFTFFSHHQYAVAFDRDGIAAGQLWRLVTCHFTHITWQHLLWNSLSLVAVYWIFYSNLSQLTFVGLLFPLSLMTGGFLYLFVPELHWYRGFSGVLHGLVIVGAFNNLKANRLLGIATVVGILLKIVVECNSDVSVRDYLGNMRVVSEAHLAGTIGGFFTIGLIALYRYYFFRTLQKRLPPR